MSRQSATNALPDADKVLARYAEMINRHDFNLVSPLIAEDAVFWFGDGSHVGLAAVRAAFEATWRHLVDETYWLEDVRWIAQGNDAASCLYSSTGAPSLTAFPRRNRDAVLVSLRERPMAGGSCMSI